MTTKLHRHFDVEGNELEPTYIQLSEEEAADEAERKAMEKAEELIDAIGNMPEAKTFLKRLVRRLIRNGALP